MTSDKEQLQADEPAGSGRDEETKVGVYICHCGGNISDHVDVQQVADSVKDLPGVCKVHTNSFMCSDPGQELIAEDIKNGEINRVVVASCAPSLHETTFRNAIRRAQMNPYLYEHANIREQVSWVHDGKPATDKAVRLVSAAVAKAGDLKPLEPIRVDARRHITVIGGGIAGMKAGLDLARQGFEVAIVEISSFLGGQAAALGRVYPTDQPASELIRSLFSALSKEKKITVYSRAHLTDFKGFIGNFELTLSRSNDEKALPETAKQIDIKRASRGDYIDNAGIYMPPFNDESQTFLKTGAVVMATGFKTYAPLEGELGFGQSGNVTTLKQFVMDLKHAGEQDGVLMVNGKKINRLAFVHCVGSRQIPGIHQPGEDGSLNEYCSRTCCSAVLQAANQVREMCPGTDVFDFYRDIRTYGRFHEDIYDKTAENNVMFFRFEPDAPPQVTVNEDKRYPLSIKVKDVLTFNEEIQADVDMVVLATGMVPTPITEMVEKMKLPVGADRFLQEVHPKLRPVEVANTGILLAGTCQAPMDITETCAASGAASVKASALLKKGMVELDPFVAQVNTDLCKGHGSCAAACPVDDAITLDGKATVNPALCVGCGICTAVCPENAIDVSGWSLKQYERMVDAILAA